MAYKLLALDMDGTLLDSTKRVLPSTRDALLRLAKGGTPIAYCTGRCFGELLDYPKELPCIRYGVLSSGAIVYDFQEQTTLSSRPISASTLLTAMELAIEQDVMVHIMAPTASVARASDIARMPQLGLGVYQSMFERICIRVDDLCSWIGEHDGEVVKINFYHATSDGREITRRKLEAAGLPLTLANSEAASLECNALGVSKAEGLRVLSEHLGCTMDDVVAVGDSDNDVEALAAVGMPVAMGNATGKARELASLIVADNDHDGIAEVVERLFA